MLGSPAARRGLNALVLVLALAGPARVVADTAQLHNTTGLAYYYQGKDSQAYEEFVKALELDPSQAAPHFNLGRLFERQAKFREALEQYRQALELDPAMEEALRAVERLQGQPAPAPGFPAQQTPAATDADLAKLAGDIETAWKKGDKAAARTRLADSLATHPDAVPLLMLQSLFDEQAGNIAGALASMQKARTVSPASPDVSTRLSLLLYRAGLFDQASEEAERALTLNPALALPHRVLGLIMLSKQKPVEAHAYFTEAVRLDPKDDISKAQIEKLAKQLGLLHYNSGLFYFQQQDWAKAKEELTQALAEGNLSPEQSALAQQYLVIAEFSAARVSQQIQKLQETRRAEQTGRIDKRLLYPEVETSPTIWPKGRYVEYSGYIVATSAEGNGSEILVTRNPNEILFRESGGGSGEFDQSYRTNTDMTNWFRVVTPKPLPIDPRVRATSRIRVQGQLGEPDFARNPYNLSYSRRKLPTVQATYLEIQRELRVVRRTQLDRDADELGRDSSTRRNPLRTRNPTPEIDTAQGLSGPLKIDYLQLPVPRRRLVGG
ncbi:MAG: tetratricopeptide repeat protein [Candidatus Wallbacteria bacterium]|nr:tetratricopeptide repeat protein [Candidatus Wallbacteria bacterium]